MNVAGNGIMSNNVFWCPLKRENTQEILSKLATHLKKGVRPQGAVEGN